MRLAATLHVSALLVTAPHLPAPPLLNPVVLAALTLAACGGELGGTRVAPRVAGTLDARTALSTDAPTEAGAEHEPGTHVHDAAAGPVGPARTTAAEREGSFPVAALDTYLDGFHFYNGRLDAQVEAHHYCANVSPDVAQCAVYDGPSRDARLVGIEYIVSERVFRGLPADEKALWHSHAYEVRSGTLVAPGLADEDGHALMARLARTYGKTWRTWRTDAREAVPLGIPQLMMGFTGDGQADLRLVAERDQRLGVSSAANARLRADLPVDPVDGAANAWERGWAMQLELQPLRTADAAGTPPRPARVEPQAPADARADPASTGAPFDRGRR